MMSGPLMQRILKRKKTACLADVLTARTFVRRLQANTREEAISELSRVVGQSSGLNASSIERAVLVRERIMATGLEKGLAVPHARLDGLTKPFVGLGISVDGIDFDASDGKPAQIILLILSPRDDESVQLDLIADIASIFRKNENRKNALQVENYNEFLSLIKSGM